MDAELKAYLEGMETRLAKGIADAREHTEEIETRLLREFWKWARTADARYRQHHSEVTGLDERVLNLEDRVRDLESKNGGA
jgi:polyhydroxyalkanoate synthesis regulator phasin